MREIRFRGKRTDNNEWVYGGIWINKTATRETVSIIDDDVDTYIVQPDTVGQYTGLKDRDYTEIYEGDVFKSGYRDNVIAVVERAIDTARYLGFTIEKERKIFYIDYERPKVKIIGNIHENPELLEDTK